MHTKSSINIQAVKANSEAHNLRKTELSYVRKDLTHKNESIVIDDIHETRARLEKLVKEKTGRAMQKRATPIREGVINLGAKQKMKDIVKMAQKIEDAFGVKTMQIHVHEDEGHHQSKLDKFGNEIKWKQNRHAHLVFNWVDENTGKSIKLGKQEMAEMQDIVAEELGMERGQSSNKKHLDSMAFKAKKIEEDAQNAKKHQKEAEIELERTKQEHKAENVSHNIKKGLGQTFKRMGRVDDATRLKEKLENRDQIIQELKKENQSLLKRDRESMPKSVFLELKNENVKMREHNLHLKEQVKNRDGIIEQTFKHAGKVIFNQDPDGRSEDILKKHLEKVGVKAELDQENRGYNRGFKM